MGLLDFFKRKEKKEENKIKIESQRSMTELEKLCGDDKETYEALLDTMFLDPRKVGVSVKEAAKNAKKI